MYLYVERIRDFFGLCAIQIYFLLTYLLTYLLTRWSPDRKCTLDALRTWKSIWWQWIITYLQYTILYNIVEELIELSDGELQAHLFNTVIGRHCVSYAIPFRILVLYRFIDSLNEWMNEWMHEWMAEWMADWVSHSFIHLFIDQLHLTMHQTIGLTYYYQTWLSD